MISEVAKVVHISKAKSYRPPRPLPAPVGPCACECNGGGFCGGCGHAGCGGRK
ncbi:hypothetical protein [Streptomyces platensis]|uniref:hypothetical protein n=1 Tax=Streptomyces platensis TaxID=58346 RepID=UPI002E808B0D|nr:hypothetical protein [Streptomyces platensis]WUB82376.1 hypothetical protein OG424_26205 [Streptomyces platensis]